MSTLGIAAALLLAGEVTGGGPARPIAYDTPAYPAACLPTDEGDAPPQTVVVVFDVTSDGVTENARVAESTDACLNDAAVKAVRGWKYSSHEKKDFDAYRWSQEATFTFVPRVETTVRIFDGRPERRIPPRYPEVCMQTATSREFVVVEFDVSAAGATKNIEAYEYTDSCFETAAIRSVKKMRYPPKLIDGKATPRKDLRLMITFELSDSPPPNEARYHPKLWKQFEAIQVALDSGRDPRAVIAELSDVEAEYGDALHADERRVFLQLRANARFRAGDVAGALADFCSLESLGGDEATMRAIRDVIAALEASLASEEGAAERDVPGETESEE